MKARAVKAENLLASLSLTSIVLLPLAEIAWRKIAERSIPGAGPFASYLLIWVALFGAAIAAREGKLLSLATGEFMPKGRLGEMAHIFSGFVGSTIATILCLASFDLLLSDKQNGEIIAMNVPVWVADLALPFGLALIALRLAYRASPGWAGRAVAALGLAAGAWIQLHPEAFAGQPVWPFLIVVFLGAIFGGPIFALLGGIAIFASLANGVKPISLLIRAQDTLTSSGGLAAIPLFTLAGFLLAEGRSSERLLRLLRALFGWAPGGTAVAAATLCAFFTLFTGGSGVTILVLGGLLLPTLVADRYRERFSIGLLTASGSLGLLFPLSLPLMLFAIVSRTVQMEDLFIGGLVPGLLMLGLLAIMGVRSGIKSQAIRSPFRAGEAMAALWEAKFELLLPVFVLGMFFTGTATLVESAPLAALYALVVQRFIHRDLPTNADIVRVMGDCATLVGGVLLILAVASGLTQYFVDAQVTTRLAAWMQAHVSSPYVFLLCLNLFLLLVGTVMDIFSAIVVVVPLILPLAAAFGVDPVQLGIIFVANLELGFLHPPLGLNLLLASVRFKKPVLEVTWATLPMLGILAIGVLLITYFPFLTLGLLHWLHPPG